MTLGPECPVQGCGKTGHRVYSQVQTPDHHATSVVLPFVFCGTAGFARGKGTLVARKGEHGLRPLAKIVRLQPASKPARATRRTHPNPARKAVRKAPRGAAKPAESGS